MTIPATYIDTSHFSVETDAIASFRIGTPIVVIQTPDTALETWVGNVVYDAGDDITTITTEDAGVTSNCSEVYRGHTFVDRTNQKSNLAKHEHGAPWDGGECAFSGFTDSGIVANLNIVGSISESVSNFVAGVNADGTATELKEVVAVENETTIDHATGQIVFGAAQAIGTTSTPTFAGLVLTNKAGVIIGSSSGVLSALNPTGPNQIVIQKEDDSGLEIADLELQRATDVNLNNLQHGESLVYNSATEKFVNALVSGGGSGSGTNISKVMALLSMFGGQSSSEEFTLDVGDLIDGGAHPIDGDKLEITWVPTYSVPVITGQSDANDQLASVLKGLDNMVTAPHPSTYCPLPLKISGTGTSNNVTVQKGTYWLYGPRWNGAYQGFQYRNVAIASDTNYTFWMIVSTFNALPNSWYAVFLRSAIIGGAVSVEAIPLFRVNTVAYSAPWTELTPGTHNDHTVTDTDFIGSDDQWNGRRLVRISRDRYDGTVYTIVDTDNSGNKITVADNLTSEIHAGDWFFILPAESLYYHCFLGLVRTANTDNYLVELERSQGTWKYFYGDTYPAVDGNLSGSTPVDTDLAALVPPTAREALVQVEIAPESAVSDLGVVSYRNSSDGTGIDRWEDFGSFNADTRSAKLEFPIEFYTSGIYRHRIYQETDAADAGIITVINFTE
jgi:hypothetical protein